MSSTGSRSRIKVSQSVRRYSVPDGVGEKFLKFLRLFGVMGGVQPPSTGVGLAPGKSFALQGCFAAGTADEDSMRKACKPSITPPSGTAPLPLSPEMAGNPSPLSSKVGLSVPLDAFVDSTSFTSGSSARLKARAVR